MAKFTLGLKHPFARIKWETSLNDGTSWAPAEEQFGVRIRHYTGPELEIDDRLLSPLDSCLVRVTATGPDGQSVQSQARLVVTAAPVIVVPEGVTVSGGGPSVEPKLLELKAS